VIYSLTTIVWFLVSICILVAIHEFGHFYVARRCGVKVIRFSIGFGKRLVRWTDAKGTEFAISAIPLGGYVKMLDEREMDVADEDKPHSFNSKSVGQRIAIAAAGPLANFILALFIYWVSFFFHGTTAYSPVIGAVEPGSIAAQARLEAGQEIISIDGQATPSRRAVGLHLLNRLGETGEIVFTVKYPDSDYKYESKAMLDGWLKGSEAPDPIGGLGLTFYIPSIVPVIDSVVEDSAAATAGVLPGDTVVEVDKLAIATWSEWVEYVRARPEVEMTVVVEREGLRVPLSLTPKLLTTEDGERYGLAGVRVVVPTFPESMVRRKDYGLVDSAGFAGKETWDMAGFVLLSMKKLILGQISTKNLSGPIGIAKVAASHAEHGFWAFLSFLAHLSIVLGVLNLLPIPVLDGGHILFCLVEWVKGSPVSENVQMMGLKMGMIMIFGVMIIAFYNDILRL